MAPARPEEAAERTARHLGMCAELADLGMQLARLAAARALTEVAEPEAASTAEPFSIATAEPFLVSTAEPFSVSTAEPFSVSTAEPFSVSTAEPFSVSTAEPFSVSTAEPFLVSTAEPFSVSTAEPFSVSTAEPFSVSTAEPFLVSTAEPFSVSTPEPFSISTPEPQADALPEPRSALRQPATPRRPANQIAAARKPIDPAILFTRLAGVVRDCIALEARLAAGTYASTRLSTLRTDQRRAGLHEAFRRATDGHPDRAELLRDATDRVDEELAADPEQSISPQQIFFAICEDLGIEIDLATLPDEYIGLYDDADEDAPEPCATYPP